MKRMTTDNPQLNIERLLNTARAENNQAVLHLGDEVITLAEYIAKCAKEYGCDVTQESVMDGDNCCECDCPVAILNILGIQAAENNARLKMIEKILGNDYDLDRLRELIKADREGRCVVLPVKPDSYAYACCKDFPDPIKDYYPMASMILADIERGYSISYDKNQAESALKAMKERE